jgi:hypothetical protein
MHRFNIICFLFFSLFLSLGVNSYYTTRFQNDVIDIAQTDKTNQANLQSEYVLAPLSLDMNICGSRSSITFIFNGGEFLGKDKNESTTIRQIDFLLDSYRSYLTINGITSHVFHISLHTALYILIQAFLI